MDYKFPPLVDCPGRANARKNRIISRTLTVVSLLGSVLMTMSAMAQPADMPSVVPALGMVCQIHSAK